MTLDALLLSRLQFALVIGCHILLPAFTVGLASFIALNEGIALIAKREVNMRIAGFWTRIFAVAFGMGVVSGVVLPFQFGTNWSNFADTTADVLSPLFAYEGLTAFFLEAAFLSVLLFGRKLVPPWAHFASALIVASGTLLSSFWILAANSWMQTPAGFTLKDGRFEPASWLAIIFNPSFPYRLAHTVTGFYITTGFVVLGVAARFLRQDKASSEARTMFSMAAWLLAVLVPLQILLGDMHGLNTLAYQPAKLAAIEAHWTRETHAPLILFAIPDQARETNRFTVAVPELGSLILTHSFGGAVPGLKDYPADQRAPVIFPFFAFRIMVGLGLVMLIVALAGLALRLKGRLYDSRLYLRLCEAAAPLGFVAVLAGWVTTETGRQPWTVYGLFRTAQSVSPALTGPDVLVSLIAYAAVYLTILPAGFILMRKIVRKGLHPAPPAPVEAGRPAAAVVPPPSGNTPSGDAPLGGTLMGDGP